MAKKIVDRVREWSQQADTPVPDWPQQLTSPADFLTIHSQIHYLATLFDEYEPTRGAGHPGFIDRVSDWLNCVPDQFRAEQQLLLQLIPHISFFGSAEFDSLYQSAYNGPIARWLLDQVNVRLNDPDAQEILRDAVQATWFCGITDSMQIAKFYHVNRIAGVDLRPDWRTLRQLGSPQSIVSYMAANGLSYIVLLEDFVGSGSQMREAVMFAASLPNNCPVLLCPLIICPDGVAMGRMLEMQFPNKLTFRLALEIPEGCLVRPVPAANEHPLYAKIRAAVQRLEPYVKSNTDPKWYGNFGFGANGGTGALVVMYTNCPDNVLPVIHYSHEGSQWRPLFPRASRL